MDNFLFLLDIKDYSISPLLLIGIVLLVIIFLKDLKKKDNDSNIINGGVDNNVNSVNNQSVSVVNSTNVTNSQISPVQNNTNFVKNQNVPDLNISNNNYSFLMYVEDVFTITGRGTVVTGHVERGNLHINDEVDILCSSGVKRSIVTGIEMFRKTLDYAQAGDNVGVLLSDISRDEINRGDSIVKK